MTVSFFGSLSNLTQCFLEVGNDCGMVWFRGFLLVYLEWKYPKEKVFDRF